MSNRTLADLEISLSPKGLGNLAKHLYGNDFTFIVGENLYQCPSFIASFLSARICHHQSNDATLRTFSIETADPTHSFEKILQICHGLSFRVGEQSAFFFRSVCCKLWNRELFEQIFGRFETDLTILNVLDRLGFLFSTGESCESEMLHFITLL
jgi:hypothetical protein